MVKSNRSILKSAGIVGIITLASRFLGVVRDAVIAARLGAGYLSDIFNIAFEIPHLTRRVLGEGALSAFIVPIFSKVRHHEGEDAGWRFLSNALNTITLVTFLMTILGCIASKYLFIVFGGLKYMVAEETNYLILGAKLTRIMFPFVMALAICSMLMGALHSLKHFTMPALGSIMLNLTIIASSAIFMYAPRESFLFVLGWAVLAGVVLRVLILIPPLLKRGFRFYLRMNFKSPYLRDLFRMILPALYGIAVVQINISVNLNFANFIGPGSPTYLRNAIRLIEFPIAIFATALGTALLPYMTQSMLKKDFDELRSMTAMSMRLLLVVFVPAMVGIFVIGDAVVGTILERGYWTAHATNETALALRFYALGLLPMAALKIILPLYYAREDLMTPLKVGVAAMLINIALNTYFVLTKSPLRHAALALSTSIASGVNFGLLLYLLARKFGRLWDASIIATAVKVTISAAAMAVVCWIVYGALRERMWDNGFAARAFITLLCTGLGIGVYVGVAVLLRTPGINAAVDIVLRRKRKTPPISGED